ncbi:membrane protein [Pseudoalteromonas luteoviolacea]|nr:membrane protein [Pseudoalteromonas luteoviolacea]
MSQIPKQPTTKLFYKLALFGYIGLLTLMPLWLFFISPREGHSIGFMFVVYILPLLLPLRGILKDKPYTFAWANFIVLIYFIHGFTLLWIASDELVWVLLELLFSTCMFIGCTYYARHRGQELGLKIRKLKEDLADEKSAHKNDS